MDWAGNSGEIALQYLNRLQNTNHFLLADAATGSVRQVLTERDEAWVDVVDDLRWMDGGARFTWMSERDGWRRAYLVSRDGKTIEPVTPPEFDVIEVAHIDSAGNSLYVIASPTDATQRFLYRIPMSGGPAERLTSEGVGGTHAYQFSPDAKWAIHTWSTFGEPPRIELVSLPEHEVVRTLEGNERLRGTVGRLERGEMEFFKVDVGEGVELDGYLMTPPNFDSDLRWPVIFHVYGEPWSQTVVDSWGSLDYIWHLLLAQRGYVIMSLDNRGTPAPKGREWRKSVYGQIGVLSSQDQAAGLSAIQERFDWVDPQRIGIWGWSGGGSMTLNMMFRHPDSYAVGVAVAPVPDQRLYDTIYQERYSGLPTTNSEGYRLGSPITFADQLRGHLLLVHGTGDDNVHFQGTERLIDALIRHDKQFTLMTYPNRSHGIFEGENTRRHLFKLMTGFFLDRLVPGGR
jgi:dipeptidyl-peptidase-4